ncbi:MAG: TlpA family protein disulfide reductase [Planctomycetaceae bacterium]|nr:MAG: TlpA family protein disulfide reductase [Planctomycetaceae bacterium]
MKLINLRLLLLLAFCGVSAMTVLWVPAGRDQVLALESETPSSDEEETVLGIGSAAPKLDVEHWIQDGNGFFKPVTEFEEGKVYVVEFWATWCGPCLASMPHLAELQNRYRGQGVQIVSISDEPLEEVTTFLKRKTTTADGDETTFAEITSAYSLTTDPDRSAHEAYMEGARQQGIPTAFIVGKDGKIEWIGHPMEMDEPLDQVVRGAWDRKKYLEMFEAKRSFDALLQQLTQMVNRGRFPEAVELVDGELKKSLPPEITTQLNGIRFQIKMMGGMIDEELTTALVTRLADSKGDAIGVARIAFQLLQANQNPAAQGQPGLVSLMKSSIEAINEEIEGAEKQLQPLLFDTVAHLHEATGDLDAAIKAQEAGIERADPATKERLGRYLEQLQEAKEAASNPPADN